MHFSFLSSRPLALPIFAVVLSIDLSVMTHKSLRCTLGSRTTEQALGATPAAATHHHAAQNGDAEVQT